MGKGKKLRKPYPVSKDPGPEGFPRALRNPRMDSVREARLKRQSPKVKSRTANSSLGRRQHKK